MSSPLDDLLATIEAQLQDMQATLLAADPLSLEKTAAQLREAATAFAQALAAGPAPADARQRVQAVAANLGLLRDQLARVLALTERQAASLLPPAEGVTYGPSSAGQAARIYRAPS
jgi:uncharacterized membrane protein YccC